MNRKDYKNYPITTSLIVISVIVYLLSFILYGPTMNAYQALHLGAYNGFYVQHTHEYYRFITSNFIHFGILHIVVNCYSLYGLGVFIEKVLGKTRYLIVVAIAALATNGLPYLLYLYNGFEGSSVSGGISGIIFGLIGALGALALLYRDIFMHIWRSLLPNLIFMLLISFFVPEISLSGHVSGFIGGFIATYILLNQKRHHDEVY